MIKIHHTPGAIPTCEIETIGIIGNIADAMANWPQYRSEIAQAIADWATDLATGTPPPSPPSPDWAAICLAMLQDPAYDRLSDHWAQHANRPWTRLENAMAMSPPNLPLITALWEQLLSTTPSAIQPSPAAAERWQEIWAGSGVQFDASGGMSHD